MINEERINILVKYNRLTLVTPDSATQPQVCNSEPDTESKYLYYTCILYIFAITANWLKVKPQ